MAEIRPPALGEEARLREHGQHLGLPVMRQSEPVSQLAVIRQRGADEADERGAEKAALRGKAQQRERIGRGPDIGRHDVGEDELSAGLQLPMPERQQRAELSARQVLCERIRDDEIE